LGVFLLLSLIELNYVIKGGATKELGRPETRILLV
jgi:hypothetical protein